MTVVSGYAMKKITEDLELCKFDGVTQTTVYTGGVCGLVKVDLEWRKEHCEYLGDMECLKLHEIVKQLPHELLITVIIQSMFDGKILQYGNYGDEWWEIGSTCGYA